MEKKESLITTENQKPNFPVFVEAEKMFEKLAAIAAETAEPDGAQLVVVSASWAAGPGKLEQWTLLLYTAGSRDAMPGGGRLRIGSAGRNLGRHRRSRGVRDEARGVYGVGR